MVSKEDLFQTLDKIRDLPVLVVGDIILDRYIWGKVDRISPEAPVPVVNVERMEDRLGGAGNAVRNLCGIGAKVSLCGLIGGDEEGQIVLGLLEKHDVEKEGVLVDRTRPTALKTRVIAHSQQVVRIDREDPAAHGDALREGLAAVVDTQIEKSAVVIVSDYGKGTITGPVLSRFTSARESGRVGLASRPVIVDPHPENYELYSGMSVAKPNRAEAEIATGKSISGRDVAIEAAKELLAKWNAEMMMITLGELGLVIVSSQDDEGIGIDTVARDVFDVSGAGDTVTAVFSAALGVGASPEVAGHLANVAAGIVVSEVGTVPIQLDKLKDGIERFSSVS